MIRARRRSLPSFVLLAAALTVISLEVASAANANHLAQFQKTHACPSCDLTSANLAGIQAAGAKLASANLSDATFYGGNLRNADLTGAILDRTNLEMVDLTGATGAALSAARTDSRTTCPDGTAGPCK
jgi:uncharacterized protein YjbI with pentapeptide repeats